MLQITITIGAEEEKVMEEARRLEREGIAKIHEHIPTLILNVPDHRNEEMVISCSLAPSSMTIRCVATTALEWCPCSPPTGRMDGLACSRFGRATETTQGRIGMHALR